MSRRCFAVCLLLLGRAAVGHSAVDAAWEDLEQGRRHFDAGRLSQAAQAFSAGRAQGLGASARGEAQAWLYLSYVRDLDGQLAQARACLAPALAAAEAAVRLSPSAQAWSLLADVHGRFVLLGGPLDALRHGPANGRALDRAQALAPEAAEVLAARGRRYLYAPALFGGNARRAIACLERSQAALPSDITLYFLGLARRKAGDEARARVDFEASLRMNPDMRLSRRALESVPSH